MVMTMPKNAATLLPILKFEEDVTGGLMFSGMVVLFWKFLKKEGTCKVGCSCL